MFLSYKIVAEPAGRERAIYYTKQSSNLLQSNLVQSNRGVAVTSSGRLSERGRKREREREREKEREIKREREKERAREEGWGRRSVR